MEDRIGQQLGNYRLTRLLGQGGFAEVYLGEHIYLGTTIAIKVLLTQIALEDVAEFQQEARILAGLKHPHIVNVLDFGIEERTPYLMMSYAPHGTLRTRYPKGTTLPVVTTVEYVKQVAEALQYAHERKIVHRDIKPENMLIGEQNEILLSDFGIALIAQSSRYQKTTDMAGTIAYMAPEQIAGHPRAASDQYALGIVAYEWLCGKRPFHGSFTEIAVQHSIVPPTSPLEHLPTLLPDIGDVILTALAKRPEDRFASVRAFAKALEQASQGIHPTERARSVPPPSFLPSSPNIGIPLTIDATTPVSPPHQPTEEPSSMLTSQANQSVSMSVPSTEVPPDPSTSGKATDKVRVSRRTVLIGAGVVTTAAVGAGVFVFLSRQHPSSSSSVSVNINEIQPSSGDVYVCDPPSITINKGDTVNFVNNSDENQDFDLGDAQKAGVDFVVAINGSKLVTFNNSGTFTIMSEKGAHITIIVK